MSTECALAVHSLCFHYPDGTRALDDVTFSVRTGERVGIIGANGAGKSTLLLHLAGLLGPAAAIAIAGEPYTRKNARVLRRKVGLVFQQPDDQLFCPTVFEDIAFGPRNMGLSPQDVPQRVRESLASVGLEGLDDRPPHHLSLGQKKRAALAAVLAMRPEILVFDEPTSDLDPRGRRQLLELLKTIDQTQIVASHDLAFIAALCQRVLVLGEGRLVREGTPADIFGDAHFLREHGLA
jgi:cobalt/nickel transport system ATP-binding protein